VPSEIEATATYQPEQNPPVTIHLAELPAGADSDVVERVDIQLQSQDGKTSHYQ
jgi:hypothetical protein